MLTLGNDDWGRLVEGREMLGRLPDEGRETLGRLVGREFEGSRLAREDEGRLVDEFDGRDEGR